MIQSKEVEKVLELLYTLDKKRVSVDDFEPLMRILADFAKETKTAVSLELGKLEELAKEARERVAKAQESGIAAIKVEVETRLGHAISSALASIASSVTKLEGDQRVALNFLYDRVNRVKDGDDGNDGVDGEDADPDEVATLVTNKLWPNFKEEIEKLNKRIDELATKRLGSAGGGGTSAVGVASAMSFAGKTETPTGLVNGSNTVYTVKKPINFIFSFMINGETIPSSAYTVSGKTLTFGTALPAAYSGKDFEIKYI